MAEDERIMTRHPEKGKAGVNIEKWKYDRMRGAILAVLADAGPDGVPFMRSKQDTSPVLMDLVAPKLGKDWEGSVGWYTTSVKLDLMARREIEKAPGAGPQKLRLARKKRKK